LLVLLVVLQMNFGVGALPFSVGALIRLRSLAHSIERVKELSARKKESRKVKNIPCKEYLHSSPPARVSASMRRCFTRPRKTPCEEIVSHRPGGVKNFFAKYGNGQNVPGLDEERLL
jgi:hypothetical protein